jgi:predicted ATP-grasp superfamily ATP-dependent carboligase
MPLLWPRGRGDRDACGPALRWSSNPRSATASSRASDKLFVARDATAPGIASCAARLRARLDLVPGPDSQIYVYCTYVDVRGEPTRGVTVRKIRQSPPFFGVARVAEVVAEQPHLRDASIELLRRIGHRGIAIVEFKLDPRDGRFRFFEVNGRPSSTTRCRE